MISVSGTIVSFPIITASDLNNKIIRNKIKQIIHANDLSIILDIKLLFWFMSFFMILIVIYNLKFNFSGSAMASHHIFSNYRSFDWCPYAGIDDINLHIAKCRSSGQFTFSNFQNCPRISSYENELHHWTGMGIFHSSGNFTIFVRNCHFMLGEILSPITAISLGCDWTFDTNNDCVYSLCRTFLPKACQP